MDKWINIAERKPEHNTRVMIWARCKCPYFATWLQNTDGGGIFVYFFAGKAREIEAVWWAPEPQGPA